MKNEHAYRKTVAVDLDGVLAKYDGWKGLDNIGPAYKGADKFLKVLQDKGFYILLFTTRASVAEQLRLNNEQWTEHQLREKLERWLTKYNLMEYIDEIWTGRGKPVANWYVDDRAVGCYPQEWGDNPECAFEDTLDYIFEDDDWGWPE